MNLDSLLIDKPVYGLLLILADLFFKGVLILVGARLLTSLLSKSAAAARHLIWATALLIILLLPVFSFVLPPVNVPLFDRPFQVADQPLVTDDSSPILAGEGTISWSGELAPQVEIETTFPSESAVVAPAPAPPAELAQSSGSGQLTTSSTAQFWEPYVGAIMEMHWTTLLVSVWAIGVFAVFGWTFAGVTGAWWITRRAHTVRDDEWDDLVEELGDRLMIYRPVKLLMSTSISSPMTWGVWKPVVLLPIDADDWSPERRRYVMLHELAHIKRWDTLTQFGAQLSCALHWFNPLAWRGLHRLRIEQEKACDDLVLSHGMKASEYASHLLDIARSLKMPWVSPLNTISMAKPSQLEGRVVDILDPAKKSRSIGKYSAVFTCIAALLVMLPITALSPWNPNAPRISETTASLTNDELNDKVEMTWATASKPGSEDADLTALMIDESKRLAKIELKAGSERQIVLADTSEKQRRARKIAINALRKSLSDENPDVRRHAIMTLGEMEDEGSVDAMIKVLRTDSDAEVRRFAIAALDEIDSPKAIEAYTLALKDKNKDVRRFAVMALADHDDQRAMDALAKVLDDPDPDIRRYAVMGLVENGDRDATDLLVKMLDDKDHDVRRYVILGLADREDRRALPGIERAMKDEDPELRKIAVMALSEFENDQSLELLRRALKDEDDEVRSFALRALADREDKESMPIYMDLLLNDEDADVRKFAAMALGEIGCVDAVDALTKALEDSDVDVRRHAAAALSELDYGDDDDWSDDDWGENEWDNDNDWEGSVDWDSAEEFGEAMAQIGISAGQIGLAIGELSLHATADVLEGIAAGFDSAELEHELASMEHELFLSEMEIEEAMLELEQMQFELAEEWNEEALESILEALDEMEPLFESNPKFCEEVESLFDEQEARSKKRLFRKLSCEQRY